MRLLLAALACLALALTPPLLAHDGKEHKEEAAQEHVEAPPTGEAIARGHEEEAANPQRAHTIGSLMTNLHPATVHFPIALLLLAAFAELASIRRPGGLSRPAASVMAVVGGLGATLAAIFGWIHTGLWFGGEGAMMWHRWIGTGLGLAGPLIAWLALRPGNGRAMLRVLLVSAGLAILAQGYLGAELSHGAGHLWK